MKFDIELIIKHILEFNVGIPKFIILGGFIIACGVVMLLYLLKPKKPTLARIVSWSIFLIYILLVVYLTIIFREEMDAYKLSLKPIWIYKSFNYKRLVEPILNVLLFIPLGFISGAAMKHKSLLRVIILCCSISIGIEFFQLALKRGVCNIDDVIHNTVGSIIGYGLFLLCYLAIDKTKKLNNFNMFFN